MKRLRLSFGGDTRGKGAALDFEFESLVVLQELAGFEVIFV